MTMLTLEAFYQNKSLSNIFSFVAVACKFRITINADLYPAINVHLSDGTIIIFKKCSRGIYYFDKTNTEHNIINIQVTDCTFLKTV